MEADGLLSIEVAEQGTSFAPPAAHRLPASAAGCSRWPTYTAAGSGQGAPAGRVRPPMKSAKWLGTVATSLGPVRRHREYLGRHQGAPIAIYPSRESLGHPGLYATRIMNKVLVDNAILGPWIHVGSQDAAFQSAAKRSGDELIARAKVIGNYEKKGHRFVELDALVVANGTHAAGALLAHRHLPAARAGRGLAPLVIARAGGVSSTPRNHGS